MSGSIADQLLKAGLVSEERVKAAQDQKKNKSKRRAAGKKGKQGAPARSPRKKMSQSEMDLAKAYAIRAKEEQRQKQREAEDLKRRQEANAKLKKLIATASLNDKDAETARNYMHKDKVRRIYVTDKQNEALNNGEMGIVLFQGRAHIVTAEHYQQFAEIKPETAIFHSDSKETP